MAEVTNELILEPLKRLQAGQSEMKEEIKYLKSEVREGFVSMRQRHAIIDVDHSNLERRVTHNEDDIDRIKKRLELRDE